MMFAYLCVCKCSFRNVVAAERCVRGGGRQHNRLPCPWAPKPKHDNSENFTFFKNPTDIPLRMPRTPPWTSHASCAVHTVHQMPLAVSNVCAPARRTLPRVHSSQPYLVQTRKRLHRGATSKLGNALSRLAVSDLGMLMTCMPRSVALQSLI